MSKESIIRPDGGIAVAWEAKHVTWHVVLQTARETNATNGGWNHQSRWVTHGLKVMASIPSELQMWTQNSLKVGVQPLPREADFQLELRELKAKGGERGGTKRMAAANNKLGIKFYPKKPEDRLNWWLFMALRRKRCLTYELPLCAESEGLLRADLVHFVPANGLVEIIELKKELGKEGGDDRDSPLMALVEAICYGLQLLRCWTALQAELKQHLKVEPFELKNLHLILAAPDFGTNCRGKGKDLSGSHVTLLRSIVSSVEEAIKSDPAWSGITLRLSVANVPDAAVPETVGEDRWSFSEIHREGIAFEGSLLQS